MDATMKQRLIKFDEGMAWADKESCRLLRCIDKKEGQHGIVAKSEFLRSLKSLEDCPDKMAT